MPLNTKNHIFDCFSKICRRFKKNEYRFRTKKTNIFCHSVNIIKKVPTKEPFYFILKVSPQLIIELGKEGIKHGLDSTKLGD